MIDRDAAALAKPRGRDQRLSAWNLTTTCPLFEVAPFRIAVTRPIGAASADVVNEDGNVENIEAGARLWKGATVEHPAGGETVSAP